MQKCLMKWWTWTLERMILEYNDYTLYTGKTFKLEQGNTFLQFSICCRAIAQSFVVPISKSKINNFAYYWIADSTSLKNHSYSNDDLLVQWPTDIICIGTVNEPLICQLSININVILELPIIVLGICT